MMWGEYTSRFGNPYSEKENPKIGGNVAKQHKNRTKVKTYQRMYVHEKDAGNTQIRIYASSKISISDEKIKTELTGLRNHSKECIKATKNPDNKYLCSCPKI